jgi:hypothetical protein
MDRGMVCEENIEFLKQEGRRDIVGTPQLLLRQFEQPLLKGDWREVRAGVEVKLCPSPDGDEETFILCRSPGTLWVRSQKDLAIVRRFGSKRRSNSG